MQYFPSHYKHLNYSNSVVYGVSSNSKELELEMEMESYLAKTSMSSKSILSAEAAAAAAKAVAACKAHSEAERQRRKRINGHFATLRTLLPNTIKTDKASLLAEVVRSVKELNEMRIELAAPGTTQSDGFSTVSNIGNDRYYIIPSETDELNLSYSDEGRNSGTIKASFCCEDHHELIPELTRALGSIRAKVVRTEMATVGGRIKCVLWVKVSSVVPTGDDDLRVLRHALKVVLDRATLSDLSGNKRPRLCRN